MTSTVKRQMADILELCNSKISLYEEQVDNLLFDYIDKSSFNEGSNIDKFNELFTLQQTATGREEFSARHTLQRAMDYRVIYEKQGSYVWNKSTGPITLGETYSEATEFILNPKKQSLVEELEEEIKAKAIS